MWYGKIAIIMFIFSFFTLFFMYYVNTYTNTPAISANWNFQAVNQTAHLFSSVSNVNGGQNPNPALIFGDFIVGLTVVFSVLTGGGVTTMLSGLPYFNSDMLALVQIVYGSSSLMLWVYVVANRSI